MEVDVPNSKRRKRKSYGKRKTNGVSMTPISTKTSNPSTSTTMENFCTRLMRQQWFIRAGSILTIAFIAFSVGYAAKFALAYLGMDTKNAGSYVTAGLIALAIDTIAKALITIATPTYKRDGERFANAIMGTKGLTAPKQVADKIAGSFEPVTRAIAVSLAILLTVHDTSSNDANTVVSSILQWSWANQNPETVAATGTAILVALRNPDNINGIIGNNKVLSKYIARLILLLMALGLLSGMVVYTIEVILPQVKQLTDL